MRRSVDELRAFYGEPVGALVRRSVARRLEDAWGDAPGCDVLGLGYATPWLDQFRAARRTIAAMPAGQGAESWPAGVRGRAALVEETRLPFAAGLFDRVLVVHALEESDSPAALLTEAVRVMAPAGRIILAAAARGGFWARSESTPFGHGRPFTRRQLEDLVRGAELEPLAWSQTLYVPPWPLLTGAADGVEAVAQRILPGAAGLILLEAARRTYALSRPPARALRVRALAPSGLAPQAAGRSRADRTALARPRKPA